MRTRALRIPTLALNSLSRATNLQQSERCAQVSLLIQEAVSEFPLLSSRKLGSWRAVDRRPIFIRGYAVHDCAQYLETFINTCLQVRPSLGTVTR